MDQALLDRLTLAGSTRVREVLEQAFPVVPADDAVLPEAVVVVPKRTRAVVPDPVPPVTVVPEASTVVPAWRAKLDADRERLAAERAAKDAERREREAGRPVA